MIDIVIALIIVSPFLVPRIMEKVERLWGGDMWLGFASYVSPSERWYRDPQTREWRDAQEDMARGLRPGAFNEENPDYLDAMQEIDRYLK